MHGRWKCQARAEARRTVRARVPISPVSRNEEEPRRPARGPCRSLNPRLDSFPLPARSGHGLTVEVGEVSVVSGRSVIRKSDRPIKD